MKNIIIGVTLVVAFYVTLFFWDQSNKRNDRHPAVHSAAAKPDDYLLEAMENEEKGWHTRSAIKIEQAIEAIWKLENDVDDESFEHLEQAIKKLEGVHRRIVRDSLPTNKLLSVIEYALVNLAYVELGVASTYSKTNQTSETRAAIKYAKLHLNNTLDLHNPNVKEDSKLLASEVLLLKEIDSLLSLKNPSQSEYSSALDKMTKELDTVITRLE